MAKVRWTQDELDIVKANLDLSAEELATMLPGRSFSACNNVRYRYKPTKRRPSAELTRAQREVPEVKPPGQHLETLSAYFVDEPGCLDSWLYWKGYITGRELCRDMNAGILGIVTLLCEAK